MKTEKSLAIAEPQYIKGIHKSLDLSKKASMLAEFFFALAMLWWEGLRALKIDISS